MRTLRAHGVAIVFVSHFLEQVFEISDRMTVLRNGQFVGEYVTAETTQLQLVQAMIGRELETLEKIEQEAEEHTVKTQGAPLIEVLQLGRKGIVEAVDLQVFEGEVMIGVAGLLGSGRTELARLLFGADTADSGDMRMRSQHTKLRTPRQAIDHKIAFSSENRRSEGVIADLSIADNMVLAMQVSRGWLRPSRPSRRTARSAVIEALDIALPTRRR